MQCKEAASKVSNVGHFTSTVTCLLCRLSTKHGRQYLEARNKHIYECSTNSHFKCHSVYVRRIPADLKQHYSVKRLCFSLRTKSHSQAMRTASSVHQRLEDYWLGLRLQQMDIPAIHLVKTDDVEDTSPLMMDAVEMYLSIKSKDDRTFIRTARRNGEYVSKMLGN